MTYKGKYLKTQEKYYLSDVSLKYSLLGYNWKMLDGVMENIVFLELKRRGYEVFVGKMIRKKLILWRSGEKKKYMFKCVSRFHRIQTEKWET